MSLTHDNKTWRYLEVVPRRALHQHLPHHAAERPHVDLERERLSGQLLGGPANTPPSHSHGERPVHLIVTTIKWIRTSRLSIKNSLCM